MPIMIKSEFREILSDKHSQLSLSDVESAVKIMLEYIAQTLASGERVEIRGGGRFNLHYSAPHNGRNPKTGKTVSIPQKYKAHFKAGKELRERVNNSVNRVQ